MRDFDPLTHRYPRSLQEAEPDPYGWWHAAEGKASLEEWLRDPFEDDPELQAMRARGRRVALIAFALLALQALLTGVALWLGWPP